MTSALGEGERQRDSDYSSRKDSSSYEKELTPWAPDSTVKTPQAREAISLEKERHRSILVVSPSIRLPPPLQKFPLFPKASSEALNPFISRVSAVPGPIISAFALVFSPSCSFDFDGFRLFISVRVPLMQADGVRENVGHRCHMLSYHSGGFVLEFT